MPKRYQVSPQKANNSESYTAVFRNSNGVRTHRGLGTADEAEAGLIAAGLVRLWNAGVKSAAEVPTDVPLKSVRLYFGETSTQTEVVYERAGNLDDFAKIRAEVAKYPKACREPMTLVLIDRAKLRRENETQRIELTAVRRALDEITTRYRNLEASIIGRAAKAGQNAKLLYAALAEFYAYTHTKTGRDNARKNVTMACSFIVALPDSVRTIADVTPPMVSAFIDSQCVNATNRNQKRKRFKIRQILGTFVNWACGSCELPTVMNGVEATTQNEVLRERGDIHWHELAEVKRVIKNIESDYWKTLVSTLAYAGLQLAELCWLRVEDVQWNRDGSAQFWITTVNDPDDERAGHAIKAENRRRHVRLHPTLLQPLIRKHIDSGAAGKTFLFPMPQDMQRRIRTVNGGSAERWQVGTLSTVLRGHKGGKTRGKTLGILPKGMHAKSMRRTFGSLLLRSGKSYAEVAAAMGNNEKIVRAHYARLKAGEVKMDF